MAVLPTSRLEQLEWFESHNGIWTLNSGALNLTSAQMVVLSNLTNAARAAYQAMLSAQQASRNATQAWYDAQEAMSDKGADYIKTIKAYAATTNNPGVYTISQIPPPRAPQPAPLPSQPTNLSGAISPQGVLTLTWSSDRSGPSSGLFFHVERKLGDNGPWTSLGATQELTYTDAAITTYGMAVTYQVQARRGDKASPWSMPLVVDLVGAGGGNASVIATLGSDGSENAREAA
jgi:hypothetical protein